MTTRKPALLTAGLACVVALSVPAVAHDWSFGFSFGYGHRYYRPYFARTYLYRDYCTPVVVYRDYWPGAVVYGTRPVVRYFRDYRGPTVVYRDYAPRYCARPTYFTRGHHPAYRVYRTPFHSFRPYSHRPVYHSRAFWR